MPNCSCGGKILTVYIRQGKPLKWLSVGKVCIQCWTATWAAFTVPPGEDSVSVTTAWVDSELEPPDKGFRNMEIIVDPPAFLERKMGPGEPLFDKPLCTCGPGEKAKGKHNKKCPAK